MPKFKTSQISLFLLSAVYLSMAGQSVGAQSQSDQASELQRSIAYRLPDGTYEEKLSLGAPSPRASCSLPAPILSSPIGGVVVNSLIPSFQWATSGATSYHMQVSSVSNFSTMYFDTTWILMTGPNLSIEFSSNLMPNSLYYWRVASVCSDFSVGTYSGAESFSTGNLTGPFLGPPVLITPSDGEVFPSLDVMFQWGNVTGATSWQIRRYSTMSDAQNDTSYSNTSSSSSWNSTWANSTKYRFRKAGIYYWRVLAGDATAWGPLSAIRSLTVNYGLYLPLVLR